jgi:two-component sensor histidine kinase
LDWSLVERIQKCSLNLVDVIDHLLDFAQINSKAQSRKPLKDQHSLEDVKVEASGTSSSWVSLARTTEAIVDAVFYSHYFSNRDRTRPHVDLAIDLSPRSAIHCVISVGAWKRLCTNIVNNALKYTPEGHVKVSLDVEENEAGETHAYLTVADTGIGISPEFLRDSLFKSFAQEDSLAIGTGLGMSLVAQLLKEFKGKIDVQSKKGAGTTVVVKVPVKIPPKTDSEHPDGETKSNPVCLDCSVGYFEPRGNPDGTTDNHRVLSEAVKKTLQDLGVVVCSPESAAAIAILEEDFANLHGDHRTNAQRWLVLCESFASATRLRERFHQDKSLEFVPQPYGPERLATAIRALCGSDPAPTVDHTKENDQCPGASDDTTEPLRSMIESSFSALPSPPLDITLEHLNLTMPDTVAAQDAPCPAPPAVEDIPERETLDFTEPTTVPVAVEKPASSSPDNTYSTAEIKQQHESLLLLLVDDNVCTTYQRCIEKATPLTKYHSPSI